MSTTRPVALVTGASTGIGAVYADRLAARGHDLILVARDEARLSALATRLRAETGAAAEVLRADLTDAADLKRIETRLADDTRITLLVNNAGAAVPAGFDKPDLDAFERLIRLNVTAVTRLIGAVTPRFIAAGEGAIINVASVVALAPEFPLGIYGATKAYVLALSQSLQTTVGPKGVYVQAVLPGATRTEIWERAGRSVEDLAAVMEVDDLVDAALVGFDRREAVTIPPLPDEGQWQAFNNARLAMLPNFAQSQSAARYRD